MYDEQVRTNKAKDYNLRDELIWDELRQVIKGWYIIAPIEQYSGYVYFQWKENNGAIINALILFILIHCC